MSQLFIRLENIKKYYGSFEALKGIDLEIYQGEILSLLGVNGAGKTTLSSLIATLHPPTQGDILYKGESIYTDVPAFRYKLGFCPQRPNLNQMLTLEQNLVLAGRYYGLSDAKIKERIATLSDQLGLGTYMRHKAHMLSGGYKQRFMIARSLIHEPALVILDEPTVGLDPHIRRNLWEIIRGLKKQGITVLLTTHYLDEAEKLSDRVCILDKGQIKLIETPEKLKADFKQTNLEDAFVALLQPTES